MNDYLEFLKTKVEVAKESGFDVDPRNISPALKHHQRDAVRWAVKGGNRALFESFGLGKSIQQLEICRLVSEHEGGRALIVCPLDVRLEFAYDAQTHLSLPTRYVRNRAEIRQADEQVLITNYERVRDGDIDPSDFAVTSLDEASVLRSFGSKTYQEFLPLFSKVPYKYVATATPSPNRYKELIHYAGYLGVMDTGQALTRFFQRDSTKANNLTLYPHKEDEFWLWVSTWALFISKPSDLGHDDEGYALPPLEVRYHEVKVDHAGAGADRDGQQRMFRDAAAGLPAAAKEKRDSIELRIAKASEIVDEAPDDHYLIWHDLDDERDEIKSRIDDVAIITGAGDLEARAQRLHDFAHGRIPRMATKKSISAAGGNFQRHCHRAIFVGIDHKFHDFIQAIHRVYRFLQDHPVVIDVIYTESERPILEDLKKKWTAHDRMVEKMIDIIKKYGLSASAREKVLQRHIGVKRVEIKSVTPGLWTAVNNDCVEETARMEESSVDLIHTSIPFSNHYEYTPSYNDFGHNENTARFFDQMDHLSPQLLRILKPGRVFACHVKDRVLFGNATGTGMPTIEPFHAMCINHYMRHGFQYFGMITVITDVVRENNQTYRLGWTEQCKDGSKMGVGCPEYVLLFRKLPSDTSRAYADVPVNKSKDDYTRAQWQLDAHAFWRSSGNRLVSKEELETVDISDLQRVYREFSRQSVYSYDEHVALAKKLDVDGRLPATFMVVAPGSWTDEVWDDINRMRTLNGDQARRNVQMHVCPLQFDIVERIINRYSNPGELVMDPFGGLMTVPYMAVKAGRRGYGVELNSNYFRDGVGYLKSAEEQAATPSLFDFLQAV